MGHKGGLVILVLVSSFLWMFTGVGMGAMNPETASTGGSIAVLLPLLGAVVLTLITIVRVFSLRLAPDPHPRLTGVVADIISPPSG